MNMPEPSFERVWPLIEAACLGTISDRQKQELQDVLRGNAELQRVYLEYCRMHAELRYLCRASATNDAVLAKIASGDEAASLRRNGSEKTPREAALPPSSVLGFLGGTYQGAAAYLSEHHVVFGYLVAAACFAVAALVGSLVHVSHKYDDLTASRTAPDSSSFSPREEMEFVGRVTGMKDCRWAEPETGTLVGASVPLGRKYALSAGLMEITYSTGAKVVLEGPCTYEVESPAGGFLMQGKLVARIGTDRETRRQGDKENRKPISKSSSFILHPSSFVVKTPTAVVTDLGTEFGVEVSEEGHTSSHVFQGVVKIVVVGGDAEEGVVLRKNESARVKKNPAGKAHIFVSGSGTGGDGPAFVRVFPHLRIRHLDLADVVAGGDGFGRARGRGINSSTGAVVEGPIGSFGAQGDGRYHRVEGLPLVDGVFVPDGGHGPVQLDSAGHVCAAFPDTDNFTWGYIWSGEYPKVKEDVPSPTCRLEGVNYSRAPHSSLCLPTNKGITFDLGAVRRAHPTAEIKRFTAVAGNTEARSFQTNSLHQRVSADVWVFVDGRLRFSRTDFNAEAGRLSIDVALTPADRFLTLATTDAGNSANFDWTMFGDPRLEISETIDNRKEEQTRNQ